MTKQTVEDIKYIVEYCQVVWYYQLSLIWNFDIPHPLLVFSMVKAVTKIFNEIYELMQRAYKPSDCDEFYQTLSGLLPLRRRDK